MSIRHVLRPLAAVVAVLALGLAARTDAGIARFDLDGTWTGKIVCKSLAGGAKDKFTLTPTMRIQQSGLDLGIELDFGTDFDRYTGVANPDAKKPLEKGEAAIVYCGTNDRVGDGPEFDEIGRMIVKAKREGKGSFKGTSLFSDPGTLSAEAGTCKWSFKRTTNDFPTVPLTCVTGLTTP